MPELADIFRAAGPRYREAHAGRLLPSHRRAMEDIERCRTPALGGSLYVCDECRSLDYAYHSCRNRHCPKCQADRANDWLRSTRERLLPCDHYLLTFTLPEQLRGVARANQHVVYSTLFQAAAAAVQTLAADRRWIGGTVGILAVLHTWSRTMEYHPHVHLLVTAGGLSCTGVADRDAWVKPAHRRFLMPGYMLSEIFRAKVRDALNRADVVRDIDPAVWDRAWSVHVQQIGRGDQAALYLSRYIYKVALTNDRIERFEPGDTGHVTFRYIHAATGEPRRQTLPVDTFIGRFLQHVLPRGFTKVRSYGLLSPSHRPDLERARHLLQLHAQTTALPSPTSGVESNVESNVSVSTAAAGGVHTTATEPRSVRCCPVCHRGTLRLVGMIPRPRAPP